MFLLGTFDLTRCEAIPNILNIFISHPYAWTVAVASGSDECIVCSSALLLRSRREQCSRPPSERRSELRLFCGIPKHCARNPGTGKENTHFEIRMRISIHGQWADAFHATWWNTAVAMIFTCGTSATSIRERERSPYFLHQTQLLLRLAALSCERRSCGRVRG